MKSAVKRIAIIGAGAVGAVYASLLFEMDRECVSFVAGGRRREKLERDGLTVNDKPYYVHVHSPGRRNSARRSHHGCR